MHINFTMAELIEYISNGQTPTGLAVRMFYFSEWKPFGCLSHKSISYRINSVDSVAGSYGRDDELSTAIEKLRP